MHASVFSQPDDVPEVFAGARSLLSHARRARAFGNVDLCKDLAQRAYALALEVDDHLTMYQSRACVGRMHRYRGEHEEGYMAYRAALREVECHGIRRWLGAALHECFVEAMLMMQGKDSAGEAAPFGVRRVDLWRESPEGMFAFLQDFAYLRLIRGEDDARFLHQTAAQAAWYATHPFERMCLFASQVYAAGTLGHQKWYDSARKRFDYAVGELGGAEEGVAMQTLDVARGAELIGDTGRAVDYAAIARHVSGKRREFILQERAEALMLRMGVVRMDSVPVLVPATSTGIPAEPEVAGPEAGHVVS